MILLTGGAGYIGSHTLLALLKKSKNVIVLDDLSSGSLANFNAACRLAGNRGSAKFIRGSVTDKSLLSEIFKNHDIDTVCHFAARKSVSESVSYPDVYHKVNVVGTSMLLQVMNEYGVKKLLFSSSLAAHSAISPYGHSKQVIDDTLKNLASSDKALSFTSVRYANPIGCYDAALADTSQDNLLPAIMRVVKGEQDFLTIFGNDYDTPDGTALRDYVHIADVVDATLLAVDYLSKNKGYHCLPVGSGNSTSVMQVLALFAQQTNQPLPCVIKSRRTGDTAESHCDINETKKQLGWQPKRSIDDAIASVIN